MRARLIHATTRRSGNKSRREDRFEVETLTVGRGTDNRLALPGLTISLHHAAFHARADGIHVECRDVPELLVNAKRCTGEKKLEIGDVVRIGPFELRLQAPGPEEDLVLEVEQVDRGDREQIEARDIRVEHGWLTRRRLSWLLFGAVIAVFLAIPLGFGTQGSWNSGSISRKHAFIADECLACHRGFQRVRDSECLVCHAGVERHAPPEVTTRLDETRCASCHVEHSGSSGLAALEDSLCQECHENLGEIVSRTEVANAGDFGDHHPQFRLYLVTDEEVGAREPTLWDPGLQERSGICFSHLRHVGQPVPHPDGTDGHLRCDACHELDAGGKYMQPVEFERHCQACHELGFDEELKDVEALHGDAAAMRSDLREKYAELALSGEVPAEDAPPVIRFLRPGQELTEDERRIVMSWVEEQVELASAHLMGAPTRTRRCDANGAAPVERDVAECARCHHVAPRSAEDGGTGIAPVDVVDVWMPKSEFRHATHGPFQCRMCHPAAAAYDPSEADVVARPNWSLAGERPFGLYAVDELPGALAPSRQARDVLIPGYETCRDCHGGAEADPPRIASPCVLCHPFHRAEHGPMRPGETVERPHFSVHTAESRSLHSVGSYPAASHAKASAERRGG